MRTLTAAGLSLGLLGMLGCGGSGHGSSSSPATISVTLTDGPTTAYKSIFLSIISVEISKDGSAWTTLATLDGTPVDLLTLTGGIGKSLAKGVTLDPGVYGQIRLKLGSTGNTLVLADGSSVALTIPSGTQTGLKLVGNFNVQNGTTADVWIDFDGAHSIQVVGAGNSGKYMLRPVVFAFEKAVTGSVSGTLTDAADGSALAAVPVYAETLDGSGNPSIQRSAVTDAAGHYVLDLLPVGGSFYVVSAPAPGAKVYGPMASAAVAITTAAPVATFNAAFTASASNGTVNGTVTPLAGADQSDSIYLLGSVAAGSGPAQTFILRTEVAAVATTETFDLGALPAGSYNVTGKRTTTALDGTTTSAPSSPLLAPAVVTTGANTAVPVSF
jgi:hypothetical protein